MKRITVFLILILAVITISAQDITGKWKGAINVSDQSGQNIELRVHFNISASDNGYTSTLDSPDQNAFEIPVDSTIFKKPELTIKAAALNLVYVGTLIDESTINGTLNQNGASLELNLKKEAE